MEPTGTPRRWATAIAGLAIVTMAVAACGSPKQAAGNSGGSAPVKVGLIYSQTGLLASYGKQYEQGFKAGLAYATNNTNKIGKRAVQVTEVDDAGDPAKAVAAAKDLIGKGYKILAGSTASGVAVQVAPIAAENKVLFISGPAAADAITGINRYTFRSGRQSYQDVMDAESFIGDASGKKITVFAQDTEFGKANVAAVKSVMNSATVSPILVPATATDFTPFATQAKNSKPDLLFVAWAGTTASAMWTSLNQQGVLDSTKVVTGLDLRASWPIFGAAGSKLSLLAHYFDGATDNPATTALRNYLGGPTDLFNPDGFAAAQMIVHAVQQGGDNVDNMIKALEGWSFASVKGQMTIRAADHALLQPMFQAQFVGDTPKLVKTLDPNQTAPPVTQMNG